MSVSLRFIEDRDLESLTRIYNHYVTQTPVTFDVDAYTVVRRRPWLEQFSREGRYRCFVGEQDGVAIGWAATLPFRPKAAYQTTVETSIYLAPECAGRGLGARLYEQLFGDLRNAPPPDVHRALAGITNPNPASVALHRRFGFREVGTFREVGFKFGRYWDVDWFEKDLESE